MRVHGKLIAPEGMLIGGYSDVIWYCKGMGKRVGWPCMNTIQTIDAAMPHGKIKIGRDMFPVSSLKEAVGCWVAARDSYGWGASDSPSVTVTFGKAKYRISFNGRVWNRDGLEVLP
jgi:hypothetical protein